MKLLDPLRRNWRQLKSGKPGDRFERYYRNQQEGRSPVRKIVSIVISLVVLAVGIIGLPAPGPGTLVIALGLGLLAREFLFMARALDWAEPRLRKLVAAGQRLWKRSPLLAKVAFVLIAVVIAGGVALGGYELMFAN